MGKSDNSLRYIKKFLKHLKELSDLPTNSSAAVPTTSCERCRESGHPRESRELAASIGSYLQMLGNILRKRSTSRSDPDFKELSDLVAAASDAYSPTDSSAAVPTTSASGGGGGAVAAASGGGRFAKSPAASVVKESVVKESKKAAASVVKESVVKESKKHHDASAGIGARSLSLAERKNRRAESLYDAHRVKCISELALIDLLLSDNEKLLQQSILLRQDYSSGGGGAVAAASEISKNNQKVSEYLNQISENNKKISERREKFSDLLRELYKLEQRLL